jgi:hypothetical protein
MRSMMRSGNEVNEVDKNRDQADRDQADNEDDDED